MKMIFYGKVEMFFPRPRPSRARWRALHYVALAALDVCCLAHAGAGPHFEHISPLPFYAFRHGQSLANTLNIISSDPVKGSREHGLTELGVKQSHNAAIEVVLEAQATQRAVAVCSSPLLRAREAAKILLEELMNAGVDIWPDGVRTYSGLREREFGELDGEPSAMLHSVWAEDENDDTHVNYAVESAEHVRERVNMLLQALREELEPELWIVVLVAHQDVLQITQTLFANEPAGKHRILPNLALGAFRRLTNFQALAGTPLRSDGKPVPVSTLIFDLDDTLYDPSTGLSPSTLPRLYRYMVERMGFASTYSAMLLAEEYFERYGSDSAGLAVAAQEGRLPGNGSFNQPELAEWFATETPFERYLRPASKQFQELLRGCPLKLVVFTNSPKPYAEEALKALELTDIFDNEKIRSPFDRSPMRRFYAVEDVLPTCKPDPGAFRNILRRIRSSPSETIVFDDSMKNLRAAKLLGMRTVLVQSQAPSLPVRSEPAIDAAIHGIGEIFEAMHALGYEVRTSI